MKLVYFFAFCMFCVVDVVFHLVTCISFFLFSFSFIKNIFLLLYLVIFVFSRLFSAFVFFFFTHNFFHVVHWVTCNMQYNNIFRLRIQMAIQILKDFLFLNVPFFCFYLNKTRKKLYKVAEGNEKTMRKPRQRQRRKREKCE